MKSTISGTICCLGNSISCFSVIGIPCQTVFSELLEPFVAYVQPVKIEGLKKPATIFTVLTQTEPSENVISRGTLRSSSTVQITRSDKHLFLKRSDVVQYRLKGVVDLVFRTTVE